MINVVGGTYREINLDELSMELFGSGFRCSKFLLENGCSVNFHTSGNDESIRFLKENQKVYPGFKFDCTTSIELITFQYSFALDEPSIFPNLLNIPTTDQIEVDANNVIAFGMLESNYKIKAKKVVYDPQTSVEPKVFSDIGKAEKLVYIVNQTEACSIASSDSIDEIKFYFFEREKVEAFIIKNGPFGATLYTKDHDFRIPSFITNHVYKIGSGDLFTASFGYYWMEKELSIEDSAILASKSTAKFCDKKAYVDCSKEIEFNYQEFKGVDISDKQIYLASPFFSLSDLILVDKVRNALVSMGVKVFSPFHDIGLGEELAIAKKDIEEIINSDAIFLMFDNLDSGTLIESGLAMAKGIPLIGYHRTCDEHQLLMLKPGNFRTYDNLTTALYHAIWSL